MNDHDNEDAIELNDGNPDVNNAPATPRRNVQPISGIRPPQALGVDGNISEKWKLFKQKWKNYSVITNLRAQSREYQVSLLLHTLGDEALKVYNGFQFATNEDVRTCDEIITKFDSFAIGETNECYERYVFNNRDQKEGESFESFLSTIRSLVKTCNYCANCVNSIIRHRILVGIHDKDTQTTLLRERNLTLDNCIDICKAAENVKQHGQAFRHETVHKVKQHYVNKNPAKQGARPKTYPNPTSNYNPRGTARDCKFCGRKHAMIKEECPAWGKTCKTCNERNHFSNKCPQRRNKPRFRNVHQVQNNESDSEDEWINALNDNKISNTKQIRCNMRVNNHNVTFQIDTGATVNILPLKYADASKLNNTSKTLSMWNDSKIKPLGTYRTSVRNLKNKRRYSIEFVVVQENFTPLLGLKTAEQMNLITVNENDVDRVAKVTSDIVNDKYRNVLNEALGKLPGTVHLKVDKNVPPVVMPNRRVPIALRPKLKNELDRLETLGVITPVDVATPWVNQLVITEKKGGDIRICIDPRELNKALQREHYSLPILEETLHEIGQSKVFSKFDLRNGYWHVELDEESSMLTTFQTTYGRYRWRRLPFGLNVSAEIFQQKLLEALENLQGVVCIADDVIVHGKNDDDHDENVDNFMSRCNDIGLTLNNKADKKQIKLPEISFMGHRITKNGLHSDPDKVKAITEMKAPTNIDELRRFLGMVNYLAKFLPNLCNAVQPLANINKKDTPWTWSETQQTAFDNIKGLVSNTPVLSFYDPNKDLTLENDTSNYGIGSVLLQEGKPIAYASRLLTDTERRYAQIEKEMLAIVYGLQKFHHYTYG